MESIHYVIQWLCERHNLTLLNKFEKFDTIEDFINSLNEDEIQWIKETINKEYIFIFNNEPIQKTDEDKMKALLEIKHLVNIKS